MYKYNSKEYKKTASSIPQGSKQIPPSGSIVLVQINAPDEFDFEWAGTKETRSKKTNSPMLQVHTTMVADAHGDASAYGCGCWLLDYIMLDSQWTASRIGNLLSAIGYDPDVSRTLQADDLHGKLAYVQIKHESYNGEVRARIKKWVPAEAASAAGYPATDEVKLKGTNTSKPVDQDDEAVPSGVPF